MTNLAEGIAPQLYGKSCRKVNRPVAALAQIYEGAMVAEIAGAAVTGTTANAGDCIGVAEHDQLGGATDGAKRLDIMNDAIFIVKAGTAAPTEATPFGAQLFMESDNAVGTGGLGATQRKAGRFVGMTDDGQVRIFIPAYGATDATAPEDEFVQGANLTDVAATTIQRVARFSRYLVAGTMSQGETLTLGTTGAVQGDVIRVLRTSTSAFTLAFVNGGAGAGTLATLVASKIGWFQAVFDGTNWLYDGSSAV